MNPANGLVAPKASIIIRNYNYAEFLRDALDSALIQTYPLVEVIVVDDGSTDDSRDILNSYSGRCLVVLQDNGGEGSAINAGFAVAKGDIVLFLDSDDVLAPDAVSQIVSVWAPDVSHVHFLLYIMDRDGMLRLTNTPQREIVNRGLAENLSRFGEVLSGPQSSNAYAAWALRRILPLAPIDWRRAPDTYLNALTMAQGRTALVYAHLGGYRVHSRNLTHRNALEDNFRRDIIRLHPRLHEAIRSFVGEEHFAALGAILPARHWQLRLLSYLLDRENHPFPSDRLGLLIGKTTFALATRPNTTALRRIVLLGGFLALVAMPKRLRRAVLPRMLSLARATGYSMHAGRAKLFGKAPPHIHWRESFHRLRQLDKAPNAGTTIRAPSEHKETGSPPEAQSANCDIAPQSHA